MTQIKTPLTNEQLSDMSPHAIADHYGIGYSGDMNPIEHGGFFYSLGDWEKYGYASCVEFWEDPETGALIVQPGTIHKSADMTGAFQSSGIEPEHQDNIHAQIDAVRSYCGIEPDGIAYPSLKSFQFSNRKERNIWKSIRGWIEALAE